MKSRTVTCATAGKTMTLYYALKTMTFTYPLNIYNISDINNIL